VTILPGNEYFVKISYADQVGNELVGDPVNCIDWRIYMIKNAQNIDATRKYVG
jgi:hypothetical protein